MRFALIFKQITPGYYNRDSAPNVKIIFEQPVTLPDQFSRLDPLFRRNVNIGDCLHTFTDQLQNLFGVLPPHNGGKVFKNFLRIGGFLIMDFFKLFFNVGFQFRFVQVFIPD